MGEICVGVHKLLQSIFGGGFHLQFDRAYPLFQIDDILLHGQQFVVDGILTRHCFMLGQITDGFIA